MAPFRDFLSPKCKFVWTKELNNAFNQSKVIIIDAIKSGVEIFDLEKLTCLRPDWSKQGLGYFLMQKHCTCNSRLPDCCTTGWKVTLAVCRFLNGAEKNYAVIEGESLAIAWSLEQTKYFTMGCKNLVVITDHKPLVKIFGDRALNDIQNTRIIRLKQRILPWLFKVQYMPGKTNLAADAASRYPTLINELNSHDADFTDESLLIASLSNDVCHSMAITWEEIAKETRKDKVLSSVTRYIEEAAKCGVCHLPGSAISVESIRVFW